MSSRRTKVPDIPLSKDAILVAVKEAIDVAFRRRGDPLDGFVSFRDLKDSGVAKVLVGGGVNSGSGSRPRDGDGGGIFLEPSPPGTNPPPSGHTNIRTRSIWDGIQIQWDWPSGFVEYAYTEVYAAKQLTTARPSFAEAVLVGTAPGNFFNHINLGLGVTWFYWLRYIGYPQANDPNGAPQRSLYTPSEAGPGVRGTTAADPAYVLGVLEGQITADLLALGLSDRIDLVDFYYNEAGQKVQVPEVDIFDANGNVIPGAPRVLNLRNQVLAAVRDPNGEFQVAIAETARIARLDADTIAASYGVRIDLGGYVAGFGLLATRSSPTDPLETTDLFGSAFIVRANRFAVVYPDLPNAPPNPNPIIPFIVGMVDGVSTVGINGALVVDGTITARHIQAGTIGANEINADQVWARIISADRVFSSTLATRGDLSHRVVISGDGSASSQFPLWIGKGPIMDGGDAMLLVKRESDGTATLKLSGDLEVAGAGRFRTGGGGARVEIGGGDGFLLWAGIGTKNAANAKFYFKDNGDLYIRGNPVTFPVGSAAPVNSEPSTSITVTAVENMASVPVLVMARSTIYTASASYEKEYRAAIVADGIEQSVVATSAGGTSEFITHFAVVFLTPGTHTVSMSVTIPRAAGGNPVPSFEYLTSAIFALQLAANNS